MSDISVTPHTGQLSRAVTRHIDGLHNIRMTLKAGPFGYRKHVWLNLNLVRESSRGKSRRMKKPVERF